MPAKNLYRIDEEGIYSHIYNKGIEKRILFNDKEDYEVFLGYLKDYLTAPKDPDSVKKAFTVHGRTFRGTPHQPKNYFNKVELIAYSLMPDHFHLLLYQITRGSIESFIRSLCTRYSIYFNKKYQHTGTLFEGPYKSIQIKDEPLLLHLTRYLHHNGGHSSYAEYLGTRVTSWIKPKGGLSFFDKGTGGYKSKTFTSSAYKDFVEKYELAQEERESLKEITLESETQHLERRNLAGNVENYPLETSTESSEKIRLDQTLKPLERIPEFLATTVVFLLLLALGIRNIMVSTIKSPQSSQLLPTPAVLSETEEVKPKEEVRPTDVVRPTEEVNPPEEVKPTVILTIQINDASASASVNIRQRPTTDSEKIGKAKDGDTFEFVSIDSGWYEVRLADGSTGFISAEYVVEENK